MPKKLLYSAYDDGSHVHHRYWGDEYCTQKHSKPVSPLVWLTVGIAIAEFAVIFLLINNNW